MQTEFNVCVFWSQERNKILYRTLNDYSFHARGVSVDIPSGYITDFASVPRIFWSVIPPIGKHNPAALVHDYLYDNRIGTRRSADDIFLEIMRTYDVRWITRTLMYYAVRWFGWSWWRK